MRTQADEGRVTVNVLEAIDKDGEVNRIASEAQVALEKGDSPRARTLFKRAAELLEAGIPSLARPSERDLGRFLAATHYYKGGFYTQASKLCGKIREDRLPARVRPLYPPFLRDVRAREAPDYSKKTVEAISGRFIKAKLQGDVAASGQVLQLLRDHPYLFPPAQVAFARAGCCEVLGQRRAASLFFRDAWLFAGPDSNFLLLYLASLCVEARHSEAWAIIENELAQRPGVRSFVNALYVRSRQDDALSDPAERRKSRVDRLRYFESTLDAYKELPTRGREELALLMDYAFGSAWAIYLEAQDISMQLETLNRWSELRPNSPDPWMLRGMLTYPDRSSEEDFRVAIRLRSPDPRPAFFLAHAALVRSDFLNSDHLCEQALRNGPSPTIRAILLTWQAISRWNLGGRDRREIEVRFDEARRLDPDNLQILHYADAFELHSSDRSLPPAPAYDGNGQWREWAREQYAEEPRRRSAEGLNRILDPESTLQPAS